MRSRRSRLVLLGPAFVASVAYVDPGNVAANITAGSRYGSTLVWVLVVASSIAVFVQHQSAQLGLARGQSLPVLLGQRLRPLPRRLFWVQAETVAGATGLAEVIGGAVALHLLHGLPLLAGGVIVGVASMLLLAVQPMRGPRRFRVIVTALLVIIAAGFVAPLVVGPFNVHDALAGLVPRPHSTDMVLLAASSLAGTAGTDTIAGTHAAITAALGPTIGVVFALGLLASRLASTPVSSLCGCGDHERSAARAVPLLVRRLVALTPALAVLAVLAASVEPMSALVLSQVRLSFGIPFALIPLILLTGNRDVMGDNVYSSAPRVAGWTSAFLIVVLDVVLLSLPLGVGR